MVRVEPTSTPPCITNGTVYERLPGATKTVADPQQLASLFARGDQARRDAQARADRAALTLMKRALEGPAGEFVDGWAAMNIDAMPDELDELPEIDGNERSATRDATNVRFAIGIAATGNSPNTSGRLFQEDFATSVWDMLRARPSIFPPGFGRPPDTVTWSQSALTWRHQMKGHVDAVTILRAMWDGSAAAGETIATDDVYIDSLVDVRIEPAWRQAEAMVERLGGFGDVYVTVLVAGGHLPRLRDTGYIVMQRGPVLPGVDSKHVASLTRELMRATGQQVSEP